MQSTDLLSPIRTSRDFTALWLGQIMSLFGDTVLWVALPLTVLQSSNAILQLGITMSLFMIPQILLLPFTGVLVDRTSRTRIMIITDVIRFCVVSILALLYFKHWMGETILNGFVLIYGVMKALFNPAYSGARQQVFTPAIRNAAISLSQTSAQIARLLGPALGGVVVGLGSPSAGFALDALMLLASVISLMFLRIPTPQKNMNSIQGARGYFDELLGGYYAVRSHPWLWITILAFAFLSVASMGLTTILVPWLVKVHLRLSDVSYGLVNSATGIGALISAFIYSRRRTWNHRAYIAYGGLATNALAICGLSFVHTTLMLMLMMAVASAGTMMFGVVWEGSMQELISSEAYGRAASLDYFGSWVLLPVGNIFTGWLASQIGGVHTIWVESSFMVLVTIVTMAVPGVRSYN